MFKNEGASRIFKFKVHILPKPSRKTPETPKFILLRIIHHQSPFKDFDHQPQDCHRKAWVPRRRVFKMRTITDYLSKPWSNCSRNTKTPSRRMLMMRSSPSLLHQIILAYRSGNHISTFNRLNAVHSETTAYMAPVFKLWKIPGRGRRSKSSCSSNQGCSSLQNFSTLYLLYPSITWNHPTIESGVCHDVLVTTRYRWIDSIRQKYSRSKTHINWIV